MRESERGIMGQAKEHLNGGLEPWVMRYVAMFGVLLFIQGCGGYWYASHVMGAQAKCLSDVNMLRGGQCAYLIAIWRRLPRK